MAQKRKRPIELLTGEELQALFRAASRRTASGVRARAMMACWYRSGLRLAESLALMPADLDLDHGTINVKRGKGGRQRIVGIDAGGAAMLGDWARWRVKLGLTGRQPFFGTYTRGRKGRPVSPQLAEATVARLAERAGVVKPVYPHLFRHCFAAELEREGVPTSVIMRLLGHRNLGTTQVYLDHVSPTEMLDRVREREEWAA